MSQGSGDAAEKRNEPPPSKIEALDGSNYEEWSGRMRSAFKRYELLKLVMGEEKMPEEGNTRDRWIEKSAVLYDLILQSVNNDMFQHIKDLVEPDDFGPKAWKLLRGVIQPNTLPMVIVLEKELAALSMRLGDDVKPVLDKIKDTYLRMAAVGSNVSHMQQCTKIISVLDNSWDNLIPTLNTQQDQWTPEWLRQQILQEDFRRCHTGGGAANKTAEGLEDAAPDVASAALPRASAAPSWASAAPAWSSAAPAGAAAATAAASVVPPPCPGPSAPLAEPSAHLLLSPPNPAANAVSIIPRYPAVPPRPSASAAPQSVSPLPPPAVPVILLEPPLTV
ncbi:unnamed protein product [Closterium sp. NIES-54]